MYARCGALTKAQELLSESSISSVFAWTAVIAGYVQQDQCHDALYHFEYMQQAGLSPDAITFTCILKACASIRAADQGEHVHKQVVRHGLLNDNVVLGTALIDMYAKSGALAKAKRVLVELPVRDAISWSALIAGYVQHGQGEDALTCLDWMRDEGLSPTIVTFTSILKACGSIGAAYMGKQIHDEITKQGWLQKDVMLGNALVEMYAKCGVVEKAQVVLEELPVRDVFSWNVLIAAHAEQGQGYSALCCFKQMKDEGLLPNPVTFIFTLKACGGIRALDKGEEIHDEIKRKGLLGSTISLGNALVDMYAKCGAFSKAVQVLEQMPSRDVISWNTIIAGYSQAGQGQNAIDCFEKMQQEHVSPDTTTFTCILKAYGCIGALDQGEQIHDEISKQELLRTDSVLGNALVGMYSKCGAFAKARRVLEELGVGNAVSWSALITGYVEEGHYEDALSCFDRMQREGLAPNAVTFACVLKACGNIGEAKMGGQIRNEIVRQGLLRDNIVIGNALVDMYAKCGALVEACRVLEELPARDVVTWNALISSLVQEGQSQDALNCFECMQEEGLSPDRLTYTPVLKACSSIGALDVGEQIHDEVTRQGLMEHDILLGNALVDMYAKCGAVAKAWRVLGELPVRDVVSWNALIAGYAQQGQSEEALEIVNMMRQEGFSLDAITFTCILKTLGIAGAIDKGEQILNEVVGQGLLEHNTILGTALVGMYAKCGALAKARQLHENLQYKDAASWSAIISGYAKHGHSKEALACFKLMQRQGPPPDAVAFACLLKHQTRINKSFMRLPNKRCRALLLMPWLLKGIGTSNKDKQVFHEIAKQEMQGKYMAPTNALVEARA